MFATFILPFQDKSVSCFSAAAIELDNVYFCKCSRAFSASFVQSSLDSTIHIPKGTVNTAIFATSIFHSKSDLSSSPRHTSSAITAQKVASCSSEGYAVLVKDYLSRCTSNQWEQPALDVTRSLPIQYGLWLLNYPGSLFFRLRTCPLFVLLPPRPWSFYSSLDR